MRASRTLDVNTPKILCLLTVPCHPCRLCPWLISHISTVRRSVDETKPTTKIQLRLSDGQRVVGVFNLHHTVPTPPTDAWHRTALALSPAVSPASCVAGVTCIRSSCAHTPLVVLLSGSGGGYPPLHSDRPPGGSRVVRPPDAGPPAQGAPATTSPQRIHFAPICLLSMHGPCQAIVASQSRDDPVYCGSAVWGSAAAHGQLRDDRGGEAGQLGHRAGGCVSGVCCCGADWLRPRRSRCSVLLAAAGGRGARARQRFLRMHVSRSKQ